MELVANRSVVELELSRALASRRANQGNSVLLLRAAPIWRGDREFSFEDKGREVSVRIAECGTVLAVLDALATDRPDGQYLVVLTPCDTRDVGDSVLAAAMQPEIKPVDRWDLVKEAFGALYLDPALTKRDSRWIAEALLDAQPAGGWRRLSGTVLSRATALNRLAATRLGIEDADDSPVDAAVLLQWTTDRAATVTFLRLLEDERAGLMSWLAETTGGVADVIFAMAPAGLVTDAVPFGLVAAALYGPPVHAQSADTESEHIGGEAIIARVRAEERYLGGKAPDISQLRAFGEAAESLVTRWADNGHASQAAALCERAEAILKGLAGTEAGGQALASRSQVLAAGLDARFGALAESLNDVLAVAGRSPGTVPTPAPSALAAAEDAFTAVHEHGRKRDRNAEIRAAASAVRLARWLTTPEAPPVSLAEAATRMLRSWAWADLALASIARADTSRVPSLAQTYAALWERARSRRASLDEDFARKLAAWTEASSESDGLLLVENLLDRVARPLAEQRLPVIVVLDGMTAAAGIELARELTDRGDWLEAGRREDGREPVLATIPSITSVSRTSLLTGTLKSGAQAEERSGFATFWGRRKSVLFHKGDLAPEPGRPLAALVRDAIAATDTVVAVVLNTIDDALDKGKQGSAHWLLDDVSYLRPVLDEARRAGRPVILTADHGHVLDRGETASPVTSESARYRTGTPGPGEITVRGPRVLLPGQQAGGGEVVAAVDEKIHYTPRRAGYHGGASLAEVVIPVLTLLPSDTLLPPGWYAYDAVGHAPIWWDAPAIRQALSAAQAQESLKPPVRRKRPAVVARDEAALFDVTEVAVESSSESPSATSRPKRAEQAAPATLGSRVVASARLAVQRQIVRRAPTDTSIAALLDALSAAAGRLTLTEAAAATGEAPVRMSGYLAQAARLLNVDGYAVLRVIDEGRTVELNLPLLRQQFLDI
jgi:PglZ domain